MSHTLQSESAAQPEPTTATRSQPASGSTPAKKKYGPDVIYASVVQPFDKIREHLGEEMDGRWVGAMPVDTFFDELVPATKEPLPELPDDPFANVPTDGAEISLYDPFVSTRAIL